MLRTTFLAFALAIALAANAPANEPTVELEDIALNIIHTAYCVGDYDTVETLFDKLSPNGKKKFLQDASQLAAGEALLGRVFDYTVLDAEFRRNNMVMQEAMNDATRDERVTLTEERVKYLGNYLPQKIEQTQLLGRLTLSLFEQSATGATGTEQPLVVYPSQKPVQLLTRGNEIDIVCFKGDLIITAQSQNPLDTTPIIFVKLPHLENAQQINGRYIIGSDGFLTLGAAGRVYVDGLTVDECRDAIEFHLSRYQILPQPQPHAPFAVPQAASKKPSLVW